MSPLEYNYAVRRIHLMRVYGTHVISLIHHYAPECIIKQLRASILAAIYHGQVEMITNRRVGMDDKKES